MIDFDKDIEEIVGGDFATDAIFSCDIGQATIKGIFDKAYFEFVANENVKAPNYHATFLFAKSKMIEAFGQALQGFEIDAWTIEIKDVVYKVSNPIDDENNLIKVELYL